MTGTRAIKRPPRMRFVPLAITVGLVSASLLGLSTTGTLSAFVATLNNSTNTAGTGTIIMSESGPGGTCTSSPGTSTTTCSTINKFGGNTTMVPGTSSTNQVTTTVTIGNTGTAPVGTFTLTPETCNQSANGANNGTATDFCSKMHLTVTRNGTTIYPVSGTGSGTLADFGTTGAINLSGPPAPAHADTFAFTVWLDSNADNSYEGLQASVPMKWTFSS